MKKLIKLFITKHPLAELVLAFNLGLLVGVCVECLNKPSYLWLIPAVILIYGCYCWYKLKMFFEQKKESLDTIDKDKLIVTNEQWLLNSSYQEIIDSSRRINQLTGFYLAPPISSISFIILHICLHL
jgi:hypothetical protein